LIKAVTDGDEFAAALAAEALMDLLRGHAETVARG
jgi:hypothetical protein